jgi:hypothetical protein
MKARQWIFASTFLSLLASCVQIAAAATPQVLASAPLWGPAFLLPGAWWLWGRRGRTAGERADMEEQEAAGARYRRYAANGAVFALIAGVRMHCGTDTPAGMSAGFWDLVTGTVALSVWGYFVTATRPRR